MTSRLKFVLAALSIFVFIYDGRHAENFRVSWKDIQGKIKNSTITPYSTNKSTTNFSSPAPSSVEIGTLEQGGMMVVVHEDKNDHNTSNNIHLENVPNAPTNSSDDGGRNTSQVIQAQSDTTRDNSPGCCLRPSTDLTTRLTPQFFEHQRTSGIDPKTKWTGAEYEEWVAISERLNPNHTESTNLDCTTQYTFLVLEQVSGFYMRAVLTELGQGSLDNFRFYEETPGLPRILLLGDSISRGVRNQTQLHFHDQANIQGVPTNALGFSRYKTGLKHWLGHCPWDLVQFNVGMHFHPKSPNNYASWQNEYRQGLTTIVNEIRKHSPSAHVVFALTTPSPFDSNATIPNKATCPHYDKFHKAGFVPAMNNVAKSVAKKLGLTINDRYSIILPVLEKHQHKCDVHFSIDGYELLAKQDWKVFSKLLSIQDNARR